MNKNLTFVIAASFRPRGIFFAPLKGGEWKPTFPQAFWMEAKSTVLIASPILTRKAAALRAFLSHL